MADAGVVLSAPGSIALEEIRVEPPGPGEVLVRIEATGVCHSDLHVIEENGWGHPFPVLLGHEGAGTIEAVGEGVADLDAGDRVVLGWKAACGTCPKCRDGQPRHCKRPPAAPGRLFRGDQELTPVLRTGTFATHTVVPAVAAAKVPRELPMEQACLIGCAVATGVMSVLETAKVWAGARVAVIGCGAVGLSAIQGARIAGASRIVAVDAVAEKEQLARTFGATDFIDARAVDSTVAAVQALLPSGVDHAFECVGSTALIRQAVDLLDRHGQAVLLGVPSADAEAAFRVADMYLDKSVLGCRYGSSRPQIDIARYADLYRSGRLLLDELVTAVYPVEEFEAAAEATHSGRLARAVLTF